METKQLKKVTSIIQKAKLPIMLTGSGISSESGVPTFRGEQGFWRNRRPEELATREAFEQNPKLVWEWYNSRKKLILQCTPNRAHFAATSMSQSLGMTIITQNVDGFHKTAGSKKLIEMHGSLFYARYVDTDEIFEYTDTEEKGEIWELCLQGKIRPHIIWFGEPLEKKTMDAIFDCLNQTNLLIVVGTSGIVYPAAGFLVEVLKKDGYIIEINTEAKISEYERHIHIQGKAGDILPQIAMELSQ